jgi:FMN phosphatase YigB (HAD superfamily)
MEQTYIAIPGIVPTVKELHSDGMEMAVSTNKSDKSTIKRILEKWNLRFLADRVYNQQDTGFRKPHPEAFLKIFIDMRKIGLPVSPETSLLIGDYITDIHGAANVGMDSVLIAAGSPGISFKLKEPFPTFAIAEPKELLAIVSGETKPELIREITIGQTLWKNESWSIYKER